MKLILGLIIFTSVLIPQQLGFGCLGFVGGFAGYEIQGYKPTGVNGYIQTFNRIRSDSLVTPAADLKQLAGYRFGINILRNRVSGFEYTFKGFYSALTETHEAQVNSVLGKKKEEFEVKLNSFGIGIELGSTITKYLSVKIINAEISYNTAILFRKITVNDNQLIREKNTSAAGGISWNVGGGFIVYLLERQISIEGQAGLSNLKIDRLEKPDGSPFPKDELSNEPMTDFISGGGFTALIQLNISFPL